MTDFDPAALLKQIRTKTPTRALPRPPSVQEEPSFKVQELEITVQELRRELAESKKNELEAVAAKEELVSLVKALEEKQETLSHQLSCRIESLEKQLVHERNAAKQNELMDRPLKVEPKPIKLTKAEHSTEKPTEGRSVVPQSARSTKAKGQLDLTPLIELYKAMPDFPRPVLKVDFSHYR